MTLIRRTNPFGEMLSLRHAVAQMFEDLGTHPRDGAYSDEHSLAKPRQIEIKATVTEHAATGEPQAS